jgi:hypothetical protein
VSDRLVRFPGSSWQEIQALPQPLRWTVQRTIFHLLDEPVPTLAEAGGTRTPCGTRDPREKRHPTQEERAERHIRGSPRRLAGGDSSHMYQLAPALVIFAADYRAWP